MAEEEKVNEVNEVVEKKVRNRKGNRICVFEKLKVNAAEDVYGFVIIKDGFASTKDAMKDISESGVKGEVYAVGMITEDNISVEIEEKRTLKIG